MHIILAPNAFKNSATAREVADALREGLIRGGFGGQISICPVGDGGDGTGALLCDYLKAELHYYTVEDPLGRPVTAGLGWLAHSATAIIEMADASGLRLLKPQEYQPLMATSRGTGDLIRQALDLGARKIVLCIGGTATVDGGAGMLCALGLVLKDVEGRRLRPIPEDLVQLATLETTNLDPRLKEIEVTVLSDVRNRLLGPEGAAAIFGPQKGAKPQDLPLLEAGLTQWNRVVQASTGVNMDDQMGSGAAGGLAAGLSAFCSVEMVEGIHYFLTLMGFEALLKTAQWVITGEGQLDAQTLQGKAPFGVAQAAKKQGLRVIGVAGSIPVEVDATLSEFFDVLLPINAGLADMDLAQAQTRENLIRTGFMIARMYCMMESDLLSEN